MEKNGVQKHTGKVRIQLFLNNLLWSSLLLAIPGHTDHYETATNRTWQEWQKGSSFRAKRGITIISAYVPHSGTFDSIFFQISKYYFDLDFSALEMSEVSKLESNDKKEVVFV